MSKVQTDNSRLSEKVDLRLETIQKINKDTVAILECFAGDGVIYEAVRKKTDKKLNVLRIDQKEDKKGVYLKGDNLKFLKALDLTKFDIIDLDAYGSPAAQLEILFKRRYKGIVHCTYIQSGMGRLPNSLLYSYGYTREMIEKIPTLFCKDGMKKMENYLAQHGVKQITGFFESRKNYFYFVA